MATTTTLKKVLVLSSDARTCQIVSKSLADSYNVYATPTVNPDIPRFVMNFKPDLLICDYALLRQAAAASRLVASVTPPLLGDPGNRVPATAHSTTVELGQGGPQPARILCLLDRDDDEAILESYDHADDFVTVPLNGAELKQRVMGLFEGELDNLEVTDPNEDSGPWPETPPASWSFSRPGKRRSRSRSVAKRKGNSPLHIGPYEIIEMIGRGGYGVVYKAVDRSNDIPVALKMLPKESGQDAEAIKRFYRETQAVRQLDHPNIVRFYDVDTHNGRMYFTMELVEGTDLKDIADHEAPLDLRRAANYVCQVANGLKTLEPLQFVHRDVKPENMILCADGTVKLIDFGLVKMAHAKSITHIDEVLGTVYYMGPEYLTGSNDLDIRYDIYSLGVTFYYFLTGQYPFVGKNTNHILEMHCRKPVPRVRLKNPKVPEVIDDLISRMMAKDRKQRPSPADLIDNMVKLLGPTILHRKAVS